MPQNSECSEICDVRIPSVSFADSVPTPFGPSGHFPLIGGIGPLCPRGAQSVKKLLFSYFVSGFRGWRRGGRLCLPDEQP